MPQISFFRTGSTLLKVSAAAIATCVLLSGCAATATGDSVTPDAEPKSSANAERPADDGDADNGDADDAKTDGGVDAGTESPTKPSGNKAVAVSMAGQSFSFTPMSCMITDEDVLVQAPGKDDDSGDPAFLGIDLVTVGSFMQGGVRIDLGTDEPFTNTDDFISADIGGSDAHGLIFGENSLMIEAEFRFASGAPIGPATIDINCG